MGIDDLKSIGKIFQEAGKIEQYQQILDLQQQMLDMQRKINDLEKENKELENKLKIQSALVYEDNAYWTKKGDEKDGPFCSCCWDDERKIIRMQPCGNPAYCDCPKCKNKGVRIYPEKQPPVITNSYYDIF